MNRLLVSSIVTGFAVITSGIIVITVDPYTTTALVRSLFYITGILSIAGVFATLYLFRQQKSNSNIQDFS